MDGKTKDPGHKMAEIARKASGLSKEDLKATKKASDEEKNGKPKPIPTPNSKKWLDKVKRSGKVRKPFVEDSDRFLRMYQGDYSDRPDNSAKRRRRANQMSVNIVYSHVEIITPTVFNGFPYVKVRPKPKVGESSDKAEARARSMELCLTYWFKELGVDEELRDVFFDTFFGPAVVEVGWETAIEDRQQDYENEDGVDENGEEVVVLKDRPFIMRRDYRNIYFDPDPRRRRDCRWIAVEEVIAYNDFLASSQYTEKAKKKVKPQLYPMRDEDRAWMGRDDDKGEKEWVQIFTIWDKDNRKKYVVTENYPGYCNTDDEEGEDWPYDLEYKDDPYPFCVHDAKKDRMSPYSWPEFKAYEPQILELNRIRQAIQTHVAKTMPKYMYTDAIGGKDVVHKLMTARSDEATKVDNLEAIRPLENAEIPKDLGTMNQMAKDDLLNVSGLFDYQNQSIADTATEASLIEGRSEVRKSMRSKLWEQFVVEIAAKLAQLCQQNMDEAVAVQIAGPNGVEWLHVTKEDIQGEFLFDIEPGVMEYKNEAIRKQQLLKFVELSNGDPNINRRGLIAKVAKELDLSPEDVILPQDQIPPPPPPEPNIKFKDIDPLSINDSALMNMILIEALRQNGVDINEMVDQAAGIAELKSSGQMAQALQKIRGGGAPGGGGAPLRALPGGQSPASSGKDMAGNGANPNGNPALPPVAGNLNQGGNPAG